MSKILNVTITGTETEIIYTVAYETGKEKKYNINNVPKTVINFLAEQPTEQATEQPEAAENSKLNNIIIDILTDAETEKNITAFIPNYITKLTFDKITDSDNNNRYNNICITYNYNYDSFDDIGNITTATATATAEQAEATAETIKLLDIMSIINKTIRKTATAEETEAAEAVKMYHYTYNNNNRTDNKQTEEQRQKLNTIAYRNRNRSDNNKTFDDIKNDFYIAFHELEKIKNENSIEIHVHDNFYIRRSKTTADIKKTENKLADAVNNLCLIFALSVLKKLANVSRTGRTAKTKHDTNYYTIQHIRNDLISSYNSLNNLIRTANSYIYNAKDNSKTIIDSVNYVDITVINELFKKSFANDGIDLLAVARYKLFELINKKVVDTTADKFLDIVFSYTDVNKRVWNDIETTTYIKNAITTGTEAETIYNVEYLSGKTKQFDKNNVPKTVLKFLETKEALKNNTINTEKNIYLTTVNTCIATEVFKAVRHYIQSEKTISTNNSYAYINDITTITDSDGKNYNFETYKRLSKFDSSLIYSINSDTMTADAEAVNRISDFIKNIKLTDNYKKVWLLLIKGYGRRTIAKKLNMNENTVNSTIRELRKKVLKCTEISNKYKYMNFKANLKALNNKLATATAEATAAEQAAEAIKSRLNKIKSIAVNKKICKSKKHYKFISAVCDSTIKKHTKISRCKNIHDNFYMCYTILTIPHCNTFISMIKNNIAVLEKTTAKQAEATATAAEATAEINENTEMLIAFLENSAISETKTAIEANRNETTIEEQLTHNFFIRRSRTEAEIKAIEKQLKNELNCYTRTLKFLNCKQIYKIDITDIKQIEATNRTKNIIKYTTTYNSGRTEATEQPTAKIKRFMSLTNSKKINDKTIVYKNAFIINTEATENNIYVIAQNNFKAYNNLMFNRAKDSRTEAEKKINKTAVLNYRNIDISTTYSKNKKNIPFSNCNSDIRKKHNNIITFIDDMIFTDNMFNSYTGLNDNYYDIAINTITVCNNSNNDITYDSICKDVDSDNKKHNEYINNLNLNNLTLYTHKMQ